MTTINNIDLPWLENIITNSDENLATQVSLLKEEYFKNYWVNFELLLFIDNQDQKQLDDYVILRDLIRNNDYLLKDELTRSKKKLSIKSKKIIENITRSILDLLPQWKKTD